MANIYGDPENLDDALSEIRWLQDRVSTLERAVESLREALDEHINGPREE